MGDRLGIHGAVDLFVKSAMQESEEGLFPPGLGQRPHDAQAPPSGVSGARVA